MGFENLIDQIELDSEAPLARAGRPTTTAATEAGLRGLETGLAEVRHIHMRLRGVAAGVNPEMASKIRCMTSAEWIHGTDEVK